MRSITFQINRANGSKGLFQTVEASATGGSIYYLHDKPTIEASSIIWMMDADRFAVSTDGGQTWNAGLTADGEAIVQRLLAEKISADVIEGGTLKLGGLNDVNGVLELYDADGNLLGMLNSAGIEMLSTGSSMGSSPTIKLNYSESGFADFIGTQAIITSYGVRTACMDDDGNILSNAGLYSNIYSSEFSANCADASGGRNIVALGVKESGCYFNINNNNMMNALLFKKGDILSNTFYCAVVLGINTRANITIPLQKYIDQAVTGANITISGSLQQDGTSYSLGATTPSIVGTLEQARSSGLLNIQFTFGAISGLSANKATTGILGITIEFT